MKTQKKLTKILMFFILAVASVVNTQNAKGQVHCTDPAIQSSIGPTGNVGIRSNNPLSSFHIGLNANVPVNYIAPYLGNTLPNPTGPDINLEGLSLHSYTSSDAFKRFSDIVALGYGNGSNGGSTLRFLTNNSNSGIAQERMRIEKNGNIGIGITNPSHKLHLHNGAIFITGTNSSGGPMILFGDDVPTTLNPTFSHPNGNWGIEYSSSTGGLNFWKPFLSAGGFDNNLLFLKDNGNVGIGTSNPSDKLEVNGDISVTGNGTNGLSTIKGHKTVGYLQLSANTWSGDGPSIEMLGAQFPNDAGTINFINHGATSKHRFLKYNTGTTNWTEQMVIDPTGNVGIGTSYPSAKLHVLGGAFIERNDGSNQSNLLKILITGSGFPNLSPGTINFISGNTVSGANPDMVFCANNLDAQLVIKNNGNVGIGTYTITPCEKLSVAGAAQVDASNQNNGTITNALKLGSCGTGEGIGSNRNPTSSVNATTSFGNNLEFFTNFTRRMMITNDGRVAIGTVVPNKLSTNYKLFVNGGIKTTALCIKNYSIWPDYVFAENYKLKSLDEVEDYINENNHLPGIPSAKEINDDGIDIGAMQTKQMEKIEELTLYMIEMKKEIQTLKEENASMKSFFTNSKN